MAKRRGPTSRRRHLGRELRRERNDKGLSAEQVAKTLGWGESKVLDIEKAARQKTNPRDVDDLCRVYELGPERHAELRALAEDSKSTGWWQKYRGQLPPEYATLIEFEEEAAKVSTVGLGMVPGLAQTPEYARALLVDGPVKMSEEEIESRVEIRARRQEILTAAEDPTVLWAVLDEAVIRRVVGGPDVMCGQLERLLELAELPNVTLQVVPFGRGAHPAIAGPFSILESTNDEDGLPDTATVYLETVVSQVLLEDQQQVQAYEVAFRRAIAKALPVVDTLLLIAAAARDLRSQA
jgi:transcriptional regulator with XRE-family HTH domain